MNTKSTCSNQDGKKVAKNKNKSPNSHSVNKIESKVDEVSEGNEEDDSQENAQAKFEVELRWCIEKLQTMMSVPNLSQKQMEVKGKALGVLIDSKASLIKKRSIMRTSLGDYRLQMKNEEQKYIKVESKNMKVLPVASRNQKGTYLKKCSKSTTLNNKGENAVPDFKFNFLP